MQQGAISGHTGYSDAGILDARGAFGPRVLPLHSSATAESGSVSGVDGSVEGQFHPAAAIYGLAALCSAEAALYVWRGAPMHFDAILGALAKDPGKLLDHIAVLILGLIVYAMMKENRANFREVVKAIKENTRELALSRQHREHQEERPARRRD